MSKHRTASLPNYLDHALNVYLEDLDTNANKVIRTLIEKEMNSHFGRKAMEDVEQAFTRGKLFNLMRQKIWWRADPDEADIVLDAKLAIRHPRVKDHVTFNMAREIARSGDKEKWEELFEPLPENEDKVPA